MDKKKYMLVLTAILGVALVLIYLQFRYFGEKSYWYVVLGLLAVWIVSRWLIAKQK